MNKLKVSIVGASGYAGGELLRLLLAHPGVEVNQVTSQRQAGNPVTRVHPNLRKLTNKKFVSRADLEPCDLLFLGLPHGQSSTLLDEMAGLSERIIDLAGDFRLGGREGFVYGIPELHRDRMKNARRISSAGCNATASILGLYPLYKAGVADAERTVIEVKVGSSEGGAAVNDASHHPVRSGAVRSFKATGHRHAREIVQELSLHEPVRVHFSATAVEMVRGVLATCHVFLKENLEEKDIWKIYRTAYRDEPFIRLVKERAGSYRYPDPKILAGTNFCDVGFEKDAASNRLVVISAIDNLMKGASGQAVQAMNLMRGFDERTGLEFPGLHPI